MSRAESITEAVVEALTTPAMTSVPAARVYRDLNDALSSESWPAVLVETGDEPPPQTAAIGRKFRSLDVVVTVLAASSGGSPHTDADAAVVEAFGRLMADRTLGGLAWDIQEGPTSRTSEAYGERLAAVRKVYQIEYETEEASLV